MTSAIDLMSFACRLLLKAKPAFLPVFTHIDVVPSSPNSLSTIVSMITYSPHFLSFLDPCSSSGSAETSYILRTAFFQPYRSFDTFIASLPFGKDSTKEILNLQSSIHHQSSYEINSLRIDSLVLFALLPLRDGDLAGESLLPKPRPPRPPLNPPL
jgi:hypothetical protein